MGTKLEAELLCVGNLFDEADTHYEIPLYQRNYAWGPEQIEQLIDDVWAAALAGAGNYFLGNLVVAQKPADHLGKRVTYEVVDGQQRLTTLLMLLAALDPGTQTRAKLIYQSRRSATDALARLTTSNDDDGAGILSGFKAIQSRLGRFSSPGDDRRRFGEFLRAQVQLVRVALPDQTDLNKYFEIMNTRGQQLEQVDIIKARLMSYLRADTDGVAAQRACLAWIWDACADMDSYAQMALTPGDTERRERIFGRGWDRLNAATFNDLMTLQPQGDTGTGAGRSSALGLRDALGHYARAAEKPTPEDPENRRFESPIKFPSLLLHSLKVLRGQGSDGSEDDGQLDDSRLIKLFEAEFKPLPEPERATRAKQFVQTLLRCKFILDNFVIKREFTATNGEDGAWSLKRLTRGEMMPRAGGRTRINARFPNSFAAGGDEWDDSPVDDATRDILLLQSMLRVTYTSPRTMHWITEVLRQPLHDLNASQAAQITRRTLRGYARKKVRQAFFAGERPSGFGIERIVFTYLDYLLAQGASPSFDADPNFTFVYRNSIEHFFPQHPDREQADWNIVKPTDPELNMFGNLALVSVGANSKFSNNLPKNKTQFKETIQQRAKLQLMATQVESGTLWDRKAIRNHDEAMVELLRNDSRPEEATK